MITLDLRTKGKIADLLGGRSHEEMDADEIMALLLQISLGLMMVFIIAYFVYRGYVGTQLAQVTAYPQHKQKQILENVLERVVAEERNAMGLSIFTTLGPGGKRTYNVSGVLADDKLTDNPQMRQRFLALCSAAKERLPFNERMEDSVFIRVLDGAELQTNAPPAAMRKDRGVIARENELWLRQASKNQVQAMYADAIMVERLALGQLQRYYREHPEALTDVEIRRLITEYRTAPPERQDELIQVIRDRLYRHAKAIFQEQGAILLHEI